MRPNIFDYATSELTQDAFLAWIIKWADKEYDGQSMNKCGKDIVSLLSNGKIPSNKKYAVEIYSQYTISNGQRMDLWITFNEFEKNAEKYSLIIEDKVDTSVHDAQLKNYRKEAEKWCKENNVKKSCYCYYKSGFLSATEKKQVEKVYSKGNWSAFSFYDILPILKEHTDNQIIEDYVNRFMMEKIDLLKVTDCEEDLYKLIISSFEKNNFLVDSKRKERDFIGVYASKNERNFWAGYWKKAELENHHFYVCCSAKKNEIEKFKKVTSEKFDFKLDEGNKCFPCDFYISEKFFNDFIKGDAEKQVTMLSALIEEIDTIIAKL